MKAKVRLLTVADLKAHEAVNQVHFQALFQRIKRDGLIKNPVVVDRKTKVILDGHHRVACLRQLGCQLVPAMVVDYFDPSIRVFLRRENLRVELLKQAVIRVGLSQKPFPYKTTRNWIKGRIRNINMPLDRLK